MAGDSEALADLRAAFQQLDTDHDGRVTYSEVQTQTSGFFPCFISCLS
jgi:Ca2+-binding EF-hand superfamily protein